MLRIITSRHSREPVVRLDGVALSPERRDDLRQLCPSLFIRDRVAKPSQRFWIALVEPGADIESLGREMDVAPADAGRDVGPVWRFVPRESEVAIDPGDV